MSFLSAFPALSRVLADPDIAMDLGTANTRVFASGRGLIVDEPSLIGVSADTGAVEAVGARALSMAELGTGRTVSPLRAGVIADIDAAVSLLTPMFRRAGGFGFVKPRVLACAPTSACDDEREAIVEAASRAGARSVKIVPEPLAAAIGSGLDVSSPYAQMIVDIGDGVTDIAIISSGEVIASYAVRTACSELHTAVGNAVRLNYNTSLSLREAERLTRAVGVEQPASLGVHRAAGTDVLTGRRVEVSVDALDIAAALEPVAEIIIRSVCSAVRDLSWTMSCEVIESGLCLTGGGARLPGMASRLRGATSIDVHVSGDPLHAVINGARQMLSASQRIGFWAS